jgi:hypothetical protein
MLRFQLSLIGWLLIFCSVTRAGEPAPTFRAYGFYASQNSGGQLLSGGLSWNPSFFALGPLFTDGVVGTQLLKNSAGGLVPAFDLGVTLGFRFAKDFRVESQAVGIFAPFSASTLGGVLSSAAGALGANLAVARSFWIMDGLWIGYRRWLAADDINEFRLGALFRL